MSRNVLIFYFQLPHFPCFKYFFIVYPFTLPILIDILTLSTDSSTVDFMIKYAVWLTRWQLVIHGDNKIRKLALCRFFQRSLWWQWQRRRIKCGLLPSKHHSTTSTHLCHLFEAALISLWVYSQWCTFVILKILTNVCVPLWTFYGEILHIDGLVSNCNNCNSHTLEFFAQKHQLDNIKRFFIAGGRVS